MAIIHRTTMSPGKLELLAAWLPAQPWYHRSGRAPELARAGGFRLDDPQGEVGIEFMVVTDGPESGGAAYHVPMTYRAQALPGADGGPSAHRQPVNSCCVQASPSHSRNRSSSTSSSVLILSGMAAPGDDMVLALAIWRRLPLFPRDGPAKLASPAQVACGWNLAGATAPPTGQVARNMLGWAMEKCA